MRLIDADALEPDADYDDGEFWAVSITQIHNAPTIEPIRCGECKYWNEDGTCRILEKYIFNDDFFCVNAERKEGEADD